MNSSKIKTSWDLSPLFSSPNDPAIELEKEKIIQETERFKENWGNRDDYLKDPKILAQALGEYENWARNFGVYGKAGFYFGLRNALDQNDPQVKAGLAKIVEFGNKIQNEIQFFELRLSQIRADLHRFFLDSPQLKEYRHYLDRLFDRAKYLLSDPEEKIINLKSITSHFNWERMTSGILAKEEREIWVKDETKDKSSGAKVRRMENRSKEEGAKYRKEKKNFSEIIELLSNRDKKVRDSAAQAFNDILASWIDIGEAEINSLLQDKKTEDELRKMPRPDLARHLADDISSEIVDAVIKTVSDHYAISQRYYQLKARLLGVPKLAYHERTVPYGKFDRKFSFAEAAELVGRVFSNLDPEFKDIFDSFLAAGQVDVYPKTGKQHGAFCSSDLLTEPTYVLLNHTGELRNITTIAHEFGHAINDTLMRSKQNALNFHTPLSTAEVASTFMEDFVLEEILKTAGPEEKLAILMAKLDEDIGAIFRQVSFYRFETRLHTAFRQKSFLPKEEIGRIFLEEGGKMLGPAVELSHGSENWWLYISHFRNYFYVYSYASGLLISKSLQAGVKNDPKYVKKVKEFLSAGTSDSPKNIFLKLGIDISDPKFWEKGISQVQNLLEETEKLAKKLGKI